MAQMSGDLHCHSIHSDGSNTVEQIVDFALRRGLTHIALTDHDTMAGVDEITRCAAQKGLCVIPGVECTSTDYRRNRPVHLLCYFPKDRESLTYFLNVTLENRRIAKMEMVQKLKKLYPITDEDVMRLSQKSASIHEVHLMQAIADMGYTPTVCGPLLTELIGKNGSCYVPVKYPDIMDTVNMIRKAGGLAVLAHPGQFNSLELAQELCEQGLLDGIECYHPRNTPEVTTYCLDLVKRYRLVETGGTDFHGMYSSKPKPVGTCTTEGHQLLRLIELGQGSASR